MTEVTTHVIDVQRRYHDFEDYWTTVLGGPSIGPTLAAMPPAAVTELQARVRDKLPVATDGSITCTARANAVKGRVAD